MKSRGSYEELSWGVAESFGRRVVESDRGELSGVILDNSR